MVTPFELQLEVRGIGIVTGMSIISWYVFRHPATRKAALRAFGEGVGRALLDVAWVLIGMGATAPLFWVMIVEAHLDPLGTVLLCVGVGYLLVGFFRPHWFLWHWRMQQLSARIGEEGAVRLYYVASSLLILGGGVLAYLHRALG